VGNINTCTGEYFSTVPNGVFKDGHWREMSANAAKLYGAIYYVGCRDSKNELELSNRDIRELTGLWDKQTKDARKELVKRKLLQVKKTTRDRHARIVYVLCNSKTGQPIPSFYEQSQLRKIKAEVGDDFLTTDLADSFVRDEISKHPELAASLHLSVFALPPEFYFKYFQHYSDSELKAASKSGWVSTCCRLHNDDKPSLGFNIESGNWRCHAASCGLHGNIVQYEQRLNGGTFSEAIDRIAAIIGVKLYKPRNLATLERLCKAIQYDYHDAKGNVLYTVFRLPDKAGFPVYHRRNGRLEKGFGGRKVLFNLPRVLEAKTVCIVEGEKDACNLASLNLTDCDGLPVAATCNPQGAGKWRPEYSRPLTGKRVAILADCDDAGRDHAEQVRKSVLAYTQDVRVVGFTKSEVGVHGDVSDFLQTHGIIELVSRMGTDWFQAKPSTVELAIGLLLDIHITSCFTWLQHQLMVTLIQELEKVAKQEPSQQLTDTQTADSSVSSYSPDSVYQLV
jgi:hypothetical protein